MQRYFIPETNWKNECIHITGDDAHHISRVMRNNLGNEIICVKPTGQAAICKITDITKDMVETEVVEWLKSDTELPVHVTIAQGLPKGNKLELIFQKGTELGAARFSLFEADRSITKWNQKKSEPKLKRYRTIIKEASEQSHRNRIPDLDEPTTLNNIVKNSTDYDAVLFAYEEEAKTQTFSSFSSALQEIQTNSHILICIGPEGGFSEQEVALLTKHNFVPVRLGARILRTETASMYALASISYHFEELRCK